MQKIHPRFNVKFLRNVVPNYYAETILELDNQQINKLGIKSVAFDADSTLVVPYASAVERHYLEHLSELNIPIYIATNRPAPRGDGLAKSIKASGILHATRQFRKPQAEYFKRLIALTKVDASSIIMVGDRLFTDIIGANRQGIRTLYVKSLGNDPYYIKYTGLRKLEVLLFKILGRLE